MKQVSVALLITAGTVAISLLGCTKEPAYKKYIRDQIEMSEPLDDIRLPSHLWKRFESHYIPGAAPKEKKEGEAGAGAESQETKAKPVAVVGGVTQGSVPRRYIGARVMLSEKTSDVLKGRDLELVYRNGGGDLDLADFLSTEKDGTFYFWAMPDLELTKDDTVYVYFLSRSPKQKIDDEEYGSGCGEYFNVTTFYKNVLSQSGLEVNSTAGRHVGTLGGIYFFIVPKDGVLNIAYVNIRDSRYSKMMCGAKS